MSEESIIWSKVIEHEGWGYEYTYLNEKVNLKFKAGETQMVRWPDGHIDNLKLKSEIIKISDPSFGSFSKERFFIEAIIHGAIILLPVEHFEFPKYT